MWVGRGEAVPLSTLRGPQRANKLALSTVSLAEPLLQGEAMGIEPCRTSVQLVTTADGLRAVHEVRRQVFVEEFGLAEAMVETPTDHHDQHVVAWVDGEAVGCLTVCETTEAAPLRHHYGLPEADGVSLRFTKLAVVPAWRRSRLAVALMVVAQCWVVEPARPAATWLVVYPCQYLHISLYGKFGFVPYCEALDTVGPCRLLLRDDRDPAVQRLLDRRRPLATTLLNRFGGEVVA